MALPKTNTLADKVDQLVALAKDLRTEYDAQARLLDQATAALLKRGAPKSHHGKPTGLADHVCAILESEGPLDRTEIRERLDQAGVAYSPNALGVLLSTSPRIHKLAPLARRKPGTPRRTGPKLARWVVKPTGLWSEP